MVDIFIDFDFWFIECLFDFVGCVEWFVCYVYGDIVIYNVVWFDNVFLCISGIVFVDWFYVVIGLVWVDVVGFIVDIIYIDLIDVLWWNCVDDLVKCVVVEFFLFIYGGLVVEFIVDFFVVILGFLECECCNFDFVGML